MCVCSSWQHACVIMRHWWLVRLPGVAAEILAADLSSVDADVNIVVLMEWCPDDVRHASETGKCSAKLYALISLVRKMMKGDVQANERMNSSISSNVDFAPNIGLPLLDARTRIKRELQIGTRGAATKWSILQPRAEQVLRTALQHLDAGHALDADASRYATAVPSVGLPSLQDSKKTPDAQWAAAAALQINKLHMSSRGELGVNYLLKFGHDDVQIGTLLHACVDKYYSVWTTVAFHVVAIDGDGFVVDLIVPFVFVPALIWHASNANTHSCDNIVCASILVLRSFRRFTLHCLHSVVHVLHVDNNACAWLGLAPISSIPLAT